MNAITNPRNEYWNGSVSWVIEANHQNDGYSFSGLLDDSVSAVRNPFHSSKGSHLNTDVKY